MNILKQLAVGGLAAIFALSLMLVAAMPVAAATINVCGDVEAYTAPTVATDGVITIDGETTVIPAGTDIGTTTSALLAALVLADVDTCLTVVTDDDSGALVSVDLAVTVEICGTPELSVGEYVVADVLIPEDALSAEAMAALEAAAAVGANVCVTLITDVDGSSGGVIGAVVEAEVTTTICVTVDAMTDDSVTLDGTVFGLTPGAMVDADVEADLELGLSLTATVDGLSAIAVVDIAGCGEAGTSPSTGTPPGGDGDAGGGDGTPGAGAGGTGNTGGTNQLPDTALAATSSTSLVLFGLLLMSVAGAVGIARATRRT